MHTFRETEVICDEVRDTLERVFAIFSSTTPETPHLSVEVGRFMATPNPSLGNWAPISWLTQGLDGRMVLAAASHIASLPRQVPFGLEEPGVPAEAAASWRDTTGEDP